MTSPSQENWANELRPAHALLHPAWLVSLAVLVANDHFFKGAGILHQVATGKLSDFAGMLVAPTLLAALLRVKSRRGVMAAHIAVAVVFSLTEISPACARLLEQGMTLLGVPWRLVPDLTDLLALPALCASWRWLVPAMDRPLVPRTRALQLVRVTAGTIGLLACVGTSKAPEPAPEVPPTPPAEPADVVAVQPAGVDLSAILGHRWRAQNDDGSWQLSYRFEGDGRYTAAGVPTWEESGRVELVRVEGQALHIRFVDRSFQGEREEPTTRILVLAADGRSFTMNGDSYVRQDDVAAVAVEDDGSQDY